MASKTYAVGDHGITDMSRVTSYGICALCGKRTTKAGMLRHLSSCLAEHEPSRGKDARLFRLRIEDAYSTIFWMDVEIKATATLEVLGDFLRQHARAQPLPSEGSGMQHALFTDERVARDSVFFEPHIPPGSYRLVFFVRGFRRNLDEAPDGRGSGVP